jgi:transposase InsO family protein
VCVAEARILIEAWRVDYNRVRPHTSLGYCTPDTLPHFTVGARCRRRQLAFKETPKT